MRSRPRILTVYGVLLLAIAISIPIQVAALRGCALWDLGALVSGTAPLNWAVMLFSLGLSLLALRGSRALVFLTPFFIGVIVWNNWLVTGLQPGVSVPLVWASTVLGVALAISPLGFSSVREVMASPGRRWWLTPVRKRVSLRTKVRPVRGGEVSAMTFDLSASGAFICTDHAVWQERLKQTSGALEVGAHCSLKVDLDSYRALHCIGKVVRHTEAKGRYPGGFAVQFEGLTPEDRRNLQKFLAHARDVADESFEKEEHAEEAPSNRMAA